MATQFKIFVTGIGGKVTLAMLTMAALIAGSISIRYFASENVSGRLDQLSETELPELEHSIGLIATTSALQQALGALLVSENSEQLDKVAREIDIVRVEIEASPREDVMGANMNGAAPREEAPDLGGQVQGSAGILSERFSAALQGFDRLAMIRRQEFSNIDAIDAMIARLRDLNVEASSVLGSRSDVAYFQVVAGGRRTSDTVNETLHRIVEKDFHDIRLSLEIDGEINLISGVVLALPSVEAAGLGAVLKEMGRVALATLEGHLKDAEEVEILADILPDLNRLAGLFGTQLNGTAGFGLDLSDVIYDSREEIDVTLRTTIGVLVSGMNTRVEEAAIQSQEAVQDLMSNQVSAIREHAMLDALVNGLVGIAFEVAVAGTPAHLEETSARLETSVATLRRLARGAPENMKPILQGIIEVADPETGLPKLRRDVLTWRGDAASAAQKVASDVGEISALTQAEGSRALSRIDEARSELGQRLGQAQRNLKLIALLALVALIPTQLLTWFSIIRPMRMVSDATHGLAAGDLRASEKLAYRNGEVGEMTRALRMFRDNIIEKNRLQEEEKIEQARRIKGEKKAHEEKLARDETERLAALDRERREQARRAVELTRENAAREAAEVEEQRQREEQSLLVSNLAEGLTKLASGNLQAKITQKFPDAYEQLRIDFNRTAEALEEIIGTISSSVDTISGDSTEIANSASELSTRTEHSVEKLLQTSAAIEEMTISVQSAASGAEQADTKVREARSEAERSGEVVSEASIAMGEIESSSDAISQIISVIEGIAFQTNLLALSAGVEAARAGEAGRGFAVVASEVRALAQRSSEAAHEIEELITKSGHQVKKGVQLVARAGSALEGISKSVVEVSYHVTDIATSAKEQAQGIGEVNAAVTKLEGFAQQNAAMFEETTAASHSLKQEAQVLSELVSKFEGRSKTEGRLESADQRDPIPEIYAPSHSEIEEHVTTGEIYVGAGRDGWFEVGDEGGSPKDAFAGDDTEVLSGSA